ncbi:MAG: hypothetical protein CFE23_04115 [Flavobacterium sp. BFFFF1]|uniref:DUF6252 family protein n=1 Tax=unclassified Flavobacterium TaxID=196869 RepID=UPI000BDC35F1|nr:MULTISPECIES: DUF6252 family protein [unclassified Flavobacterium]OYU81662.1 MAG: hypothetical protein CFE23_04115 [Flavobacterium sp. BFFFF1]
MKTMKKFGFTAMAALAIALSSCSSDSDGGSGSNAATYINASVDGTAFETFEVQGQSSASASRIVSGSDTFITITGVSSTTDAMEIVLHNITATGTYPAGPSNDLTLVYSATSSQMAYASDADCTGATGTVTVTSISDTKIEGTFSFTGKTDDCTGQKAVTNGKFRGTFAN